MEGSIWDMRNVIVLIIVNLLQPAGAAYKARPEDCILPTYSDYVISLQPSISFNATPYPFVTEDTNVTLTCSGRVDELKATLSIQPAMTKVEFQKNGTHFHECKQDFWLKLISLSCSVTVTGITSDDVFVCIVRAFRAPPCNAAQISFVVESRVAPSISNLLPAFNNDLRKLEVTCIGTGIPEPSILWLLNDSMINYTSIEKRINVKVFTTSTNNENRTRLFHVISRIVIIDAKFPLRIQCAAKNEIAEVYSNKVYAIHVEIVNLRLTTATIRWFRHPNVNTSLLDGFGYNVSLHSAKNASFETISSFNESSITFSNLTMGRRYTVKIEAFTKRRDLVAGSVGFYSPGQLRKPHDVNLAEITSQKAVIEWKMVSPNKTTQGLLLGYKVVLIKKKRTMNFTLETDKRAIVLTNLIPKSNYTVVLRGFTQYGDGDTLEYSFATLDLIPQPQNVKVISILGNSAVVQWNIIPQNLEKYDKITGYRVTIRNETNFLKNITASNDNFFVALTNLLPNTVYKVSAVALSVEAEGISSELITFKTTDLQGKPNVASHKGSDSTVAIVVLTVAVVVGAIIVLTVVAVKRFRRRAAKKTQNIKANQVVLPNVNRSFDDNLRILYPEFYNDDASNLSEELPSWEINRSRLAVLDKVLGGGYFGLVKEGVFMQSLPIDSPNEKISVAVKTLKANRGQSDWNELLREFEILKYVNSTGHQNVIQLIGACTQTVPILLVMEFCSKGNLKDLLTSSRVDEATNRKYNNIYSKLTERQLINFAVEIARGMVFLFEKKVVHRDIASRNILLDDRLIPKIADFGLARKIDDTAHYIVNKNRMLPVKWMSMESLEEGRFIPASDTWSYGVLLWEICTLAEEPYKDVSPYDMMDYLYEGNRMSRPSYCSIEIFTLMERCWQRVPEERPSFNEIFNTLQSMLTDNERSYVNVRPYHDLNETMISTPGDNLKEDRSEADTSSNVAISDQNSLRDSGVFDTAV